MMSSSGWAMNEKAKLRACDYCRKKKVRCQRIGDQCEECIKANILCTICPPIKRKRRRPPGHARINELEQQLCRMATALQVPLGVRNQQVDDILASECGTTEQSLNAEAVRRSDLQVSSNATFLSQEQRGAPWKCKATSHILPSQEFMPLPPKEEAIQLIHEVFHDFNAAFPLFDGPSFLRRVEVSYPAIKAEDTAWWACLNVVLTFALRLRALRVSGRQENEQAMWAYAKNALGVVNELQMSSPDLSTVQALLGMAIVLQGTPYSDICTSLLANAIKAAQRLGMHRNFHGFHVRPNTRIDQEQQKRVFWIAYFLDQDLSMRTGLPPTQYYDDMDIGLPLTTTEPRQGYTEDIRFFNYRIGLAIIQGHIYSRLLSVKAMKEPTEKRSLCIRELCTMLRRWKESLSVDLETFHYNRRFDTQHPITVLHAIILQFSYFNSILKIYQCASSESSVTEEYLRTRGILQETGEDVRTELVTEARKSVELLKIVPLGDNACAWLLVGSVVPVVTVLLENVIEYPEHPLAHSDLQLIQPVLVFLEPLAREVEYDAAKRTYNRCMELTRGAKAVLDITRELNQIIPTGTSINLGSSGWTLE